MLWARHSRVKLFGVGIAAVLIGFAFIFSGLFIGQKVVFNIFPPTKDTNGVAASISFAPGTTISQAKTIASQVDAIAAEVIGDNFVQSSYYGAGSAQSAVLQVELTPYSKRDISSPQIVEQLQERFDKDFKAASISVGQVDLGPPSAAFTVLIEADNRNGAYVAAKEMSAYLSNAQLKRIDGTVAKLTNVNISSPDQFIRKDGQLVVHAK